MKRVLFILLLLPLSIALYSQSAISTLYADKKLNFGVKTGFTSTIFMTSNFSMGDVKIKQVQNNYKVGYASSFFMRYNMKSHYIQSELVYSINKCEITFEKHGEKQQGFTPDYASINSRMHSIEIPILYGYNFIKKDIYGMSFFVGPKIRYFWESKSKMEYTNFDQLNIDEDFYPINFGLTAGIAVYISKIFFDFRYEQILHNISKGVDYDGMRNVSISQSDKNLSQGEIKLHRRDHMLSFSLGVIF